MHDDFYVGYQKKMPASIAAFLRVRMIGIILFIVIMAALLVTAQRPFASSRFEFGHLRSFEGTIIEHPYPTLLVTRPGLDGHRPTFSRYYLGIRGKKGAHQEVEGLDGKQVRLQGTLIYRDHQTTLEITPGSVDILKENAAIVASSLRQNLGTFTLRGEIVDSKCYMGVMKPGHLKPHRSCAIRCISGGIPPVLLVREARGMAAYLLLVDTDGGTVNHNVLDKVAVPLEITGQVERHDNLLVLKSDPETYRPLP